VRAFLTIVVGAGALLGAAPAASVAHASPIARRAGATPVAAARALANTLSREIRPAGSASGAYVVDLGTSRTLFSDRAGVARLPASVEKVYTTSTALVGLGPDARLTTTVLGRGTLDRYGGWHGTLYLKGGGDPSFGSAPFDRSDYAGGAGATVQRLVGNVIREQGITSIDGRVVGDESYFDSVRGTPATGLQASTDVEGLLSALAYDRGLADERGTAFQTRPARFAAQRFVDALRAARVRIPTRTPIFSGPAPAGARILATVHSPSLATLIALTNTPSDNFFAEMLLKVIGARLGSHGSTAAGAAVVRATLARYFEIHPRLQDGSGLSRADRTTPRQVVIALEGMAGNPAFVDSLALAGETGTLAHELQGTAAQGRCRGKTGTLHDVSNLVGYCRARDGHTLAFAFLMNRIDPHSAHQIQDRMALTLAGYAG